MGKKSELDDLRARLATLEAEVDRLRGAAAARGTTTAAVTTDQNRATARSARQSHTPVLNTTREEQPGQPQSMTRIADALGVMVSGRTEERAEEPTEEPTQVLRTRPEPPESRSAPVAERGGGQFLESLLSGRPALQK
ncbi:hypothetical protein ACIG5E_29905 [Kitasatospora sp. NPDC053057]|uniref:hypothetical protein n=1 Tax=Kitasatospora sp. NPDC053057 TaxID=3364062 RepID=UPI0037CA0FD1